MTHPPVPWQFWSQPSKIKKCVLAQFLEIPLPFPKIAGIILPLLSLWNYPAQKKLTMPYFRVVLTFWDDPHSVCGVNFSLNKPISYLSLCVSLKFFCNETSVTWASVNPETRCMTLLKSHGFKFQSEMHGFSCALPTSLLSQRNTIFRGTWFIWR